VPIRFEGTTFCAERVSQGLNAINAISMGALNIFRSLRAADIQYCEPGTLWLPSEVAKQLLLNPKLTGGVAEHGCSPALIIQRGSGMQACDDVFANSQRGAVGGGLSLWCVS
jgi:hypothetical protein